MTAGSFRFTFARRHAGPSSPGWVSLSESDFLSRQTRLRSAVELASELTPDWAEDLLTLARAVYLVDKRAPRQHATDNWTRDITLAVRLIEPERWVGEPLTLLARVLRVMSGDSWRLNVNGAATRLDAQERLDWGGWQAGEVALFSGGLDSGAYAADRVHAGVDRLLLIGHDHGGAARVQEGLFSAIDPGDGRVRLERVRDEPRRLGKLEQSTRTRGFLFAVTAVYAASAHGLREVAMPENGLVAVNPPLSPDRLGASSTRSTHPWVVYQLNRLIAMVGGAVTIRNPYLHHTKGEVCLRASEAGLSPRSLAGTVSCGSPSVVAAPFGNCGHCYPCLVRRAGLLAALGSDPTRYPHRLDELTSPSRRQHLDDLSRWLRRDFTVRDLIGDMPLPEKVRARALLPVIQRSRDELHRLLLHHAQRAVPAQDRRTISRRPSPRGP